MDYTQYLKELTSRPIPKEMAFPESEYRRRVDKVRTFMDEGNEQTREPGMTFHSPISLRLPGTAGVGFSETWVLTETGAEVLTAHDRKLTVAPA